jgi:hypothetical protein
MAVARSKEEVDLGDGHQWLQGFSAVSSRHMLHNAVQIINSTVEHTKYLLAKYTSYYRIFPE